MSDERKGLSLRTKRKKKPPISAPRQISEPIQQNRNGDTSQSQGLPSGPDHAQLRPRMGGQTSDLVKRRYSTRFNNLPADFDATAPPVPGLPSIPRQYAAANGQLNIASPARGPTLEVDLRALKEPGLRADQYVSQLLSDATEQDIDDYQESLKKLRSRTSTDLQQNVYQNRTQFIKISKEAEKLKAEMRSLRNLMSELKINATTLRAASSNTEPQFDDSFPSSLSKRDKRSSVADRTALWNSQLQSLWKSIEGSQKFLPAAPGRHVLQNAGIWIELDNATWKPRRIMQIVLLNDHLLVASRKKKKMEPGTDPRSTPSKIVADRCWPLLEIDIVDLAKSIDAGRSKNQVADAIMVRGSGQELFTYRVEKPDGTEKTSLMSNFRKAVEALRRDLQSGIETTNKSQETVEYFASRDLSILKKADSLENVAEVRDRPNILIEVDGKQQNLRWVEGQVDELDIDIALQRFDDAVNRVEKLKSLAKGLKNSVVAQELISYKADNRASKLAALIIRELVDTCNELGKTKRNVNWLARLDYEDRARESYLEARGRIIQKRSRQCIFEGNLHQYIWEVSFVYFTIIRNTVSCFQQCFPTLTMSACVKWAKEQVDTFNVLLTRQLSGVPPESVLWQECIDQVHQHADMLSEVGLDFSGLVGQHVEEVGVAQTAVGLGLS